MQPAFTVFCDIYLLLVEYISKKITKQEHMKVTAQWLTDEARTFFDSCVEGGDATPSLKKTATKWTKWVVWRYLRSSNPPEVRVQTGCQATPDRRRKQLQNKSAAKHHFPSNFLWILYLANQVGQRHLHSSQMWHWPQSACKELLQRTQLYLCQI